MTLCFDRQYHLEISNLKPDKLMSSLIKNIENGATTLDIHVQIGADSKVMVIPTAGHKIAYDLIHSSKNREKFSEIGSQTIYQNPAISEGILFSVLVDSLEWYIANRQLSFVKYNIDIVFASYPSDQLQQSIEKSAELVIRILLSNDIADRAIIQSMNPACLRYVHHQFPRIQTSLISARSNCRTLVEQLEDLGFAPTIYSPESSIVTDKLIKTCHAKKIMVIPWLINNDVEIDRLKKMGVDGIISENIPEPKNK